MYEILGLIPSTKETKVMGGMPVIPARGRWRQLTLWLYSELEAKPGKNEALTKTSLLQSQSVSDDLGASCGSVNENDSHGLTHLSVWYPAGGLFSQDWEVWPWRRSCVAGGGLWVSSARDLGLLDLMEVVLLVCLCDL